MHTGVYCSPSERKRLEKVARYIARPAVAEDRLRFDSHDDIKYKLKRPYTDGTSILIYQDAP
ncbi:MAG: transposase [Bdellovibrionota bacterium]